MRIKFFINDLTSDHIDFCDNYIKKVVTNSKITFYRMKADLKKYDVFIVSLEGCSDEIPCNDNDYEELFTTYITVNDIPIPVHNPDLAEILLELPEVQRMVVLRTVVLGEKLTDIAKELGVSVPMITKHRKKALATIKERMSERQC